MGKLAARRNRVKRTVGVGWDCADAERFLPHLQLRHRNVNSLIAQLTHNVRTLDQLIPALTRTVSARRDVEGGAGDRHASTAAAGDSATAWTPPEKELEQISWFRLRLSCPNRQFRS